MIKFEMSELKEVSVDELLKIIGWDISDWFEGEVFESGVYKIEFGSRGEIEEVEKVEVKDGVFEVMSKECVYYDDFCIDEEDYEYYKVEVEVDEEDVFENGELVVEDVSKDEDDDSGVLVYSYKGKYVLMSFDIGGSLCECDVYSSLDEVKEVM